MADVKVNKKLENRHVTSTGDMVSWCVDQSGGHVPVTVADGMEEIS